MTNDTPEREALALLKIVYYEDGFLPDDFMDRAAKVLGLVPCGDCGDDGENPLGNCPSCKGMGMVEPKAPAPSLVGEVDTTKESA